MLEKILRLYTMSMATGCTSPLPHLFGPPGCGKSSSIKAAAELLGVRMHTINLSRVSPLELEGVQMPTNDEQEMRLRLLHATFWTQIQEGDIVLFDEFLRAFPEVYNGLLDILTAREVGGLVLPPAFFIGASNSVIAYDKALEDRLLHLPVPDARKKKHEREHMAKMIVEQLGLAPQMVTSAEMETLINEEILPLYDLMDHLHKRTAPPVLKGRSVRNLIGQARLRTVESPHLADLINENNRVTRTSKKWQYLFVIDDRDFATLPGYRDTAVQLLTSGRLTEVQTENVKLNVELLGLHEAMASINEEV